MSESKFGRLEKHLGQHVFVFNEEDNGGEQVILITDFYDNGDGVFSGLYLIQEIVMASYCNSATLNLSIEITPEKLRKLADEIDWKIAEFKTKAMIDAKAEQKEAAE